MKPAPFTYHDPGTLDTALELLGRYTEEGKILAGGQSLVPLLNFRLARPKHLIDVNRLADLSYIYQQNGTLHIGALTRQAMLERSEVAAKGWPMLREAIKHIAHRQIRNRGTVGGSVAHADPLAELPVAFAALGARFHLRSLRRQRAIDWESFFVTHLTTVVEPDEMLVEIEVPAMRSGVGHSFLECARRHGDFAIGGAATLVELGPDRRCEHATIALLGAAPTPVRAREAEMELVGRPVEEATAAAAARRAAATCDLTGDIHGSSDYRRKVIETIVRRALLTAADRARLA